MESLPTEILHHIFKQIQCKSCLETDCLRTNKDYYLYDYKCSKTCSRWNKLFRGRKDRIYQLACPFVEVTLKMDTGVNLLGMTIMEKGDDAWKKGDMHWGIYVNSIEKGGPVDLDGRIEAGDMILQLNKINFDNMSIADMMMRILKIEEVFKNAVQEPGPIRLVVAKSKDPAYRELNYYKIKGPFTNYVIMLNLSLIHI